MNCTPGRTLRPWSFCGESSFVGRGDIHGNILCEPAPACPSSTRASSTRLLVTAWTFCGYSVVVRSSTVDLWRHHVFPSFMGPFEPPETRRYSGSGGRRVRLGFRSRAQRPAGVPPVYYKRPRSPRARTLWSWAVWPPSTRGTNSGHGGRSDVTSSAAVAASHRAAT